MNESNSNNPDGNKIFSGTKEVAKNLSLMKKVCKNGLMTIFQILERF